MLAALLLFVLTFVNLNCENLFDTADNPATLDDDFTPAGLYRWTNSRYYKKINNIAREILACGERTDGSSEIPDLVALEEVENDSVLADLTRHSLLRNAGYEYVITDGPDVRGINVALLYSPLSFALITYYPVRVEPLSGMRPTRDILYVKGRTAINDTLHIFVVHAPSRLGGEFETRNHRLQVTRRLAQSVDSLQSLSPEAHIIIAGDFNDPADGYSLRALDGRGLSDLAAEAKGTHGTRGTYKYREKWETIDHIFLSSSLAADAECTIYDGGAVLVRDDNYGGLRPNRNYYQIKWQNGFSDHLPLVARLFRRE